MDDGEFASKPCVIHCNVAQTCHSHRVRQFLRQDETHISCVQGVETKTKSQKRQTIELNAQQLRQRLKTRMRLIVPLLLRQFQTICHLFARKARSVKTVTVESICLKANSSKMKDKKLLKKPQMCATKLPLDLVWPEKKLNVATPLQQDEPSRTDDLQNQTMFLLKLSKMTIVLRLTKWKKNLKCCLLIVEAKKKWVS